MKGVEDDFDFDKTKYLSNVDRCFGGHFNDTREGNGEAAKAIGDQMGIVDGRQHVQPDVGEGYGKDEACRNSITNILLVINHLGTFFSNSRNPHLIDELWPC